MLPGRHLEPAGLLHCHGGVRPTRPLQTSSAEPGPARGSLLLTRRGPTYSQTPRVALGPPGRRMGEGNSGGSQGWPGVGCWGQDTCPGAPRAGSRDGGTDTGWSVSGGGRTSDPGSCPPCLRAQPGLVHDVGTTPQACGHLLWASWPQPAGFPGESTEPAGRLCPGAPAHPLSIPSLCPSPQHDGVLSGWTQCEPLGHPDGACAAAPPCHQPRAQ